MLDKNPLMIDLDIDQWSNLHNEFLVGVREKKRIVVIHEKGKVQNMSHSHDEPINDPISTVVDPQRDAKELFYANKGTTELVMILDRCSVESYYDEIQSSWTAEEDLDHYMYRMYSKLDFYYPGIVTYPGPASRQLGLQWLLPGKPSFLEVEAVINDFVEKSTVVTLAIFDGPKELWASLVLGFNEKKKISLITSVKQGLIEKNWRSEYSKINSWVGDNYWKTGLAIYMNKETYQKFSESKDPRYTFKQLCSEGSVVIDPSNSSLDTLIAKYELHELS
ncbi:MAG: hypothetical protein FXF54_11770 [Kosmotoga sp.]|nr:MAG: hypothetical protein FXF54_11770 [Kosmotoga sp.]